MDQPYFISNKYTKWYYTIIGKAQQSPIQDYTEKHHIIPRSLGGSNAKANIVKLTARQHFICHLLLVKMTSGRAQWKMICAAHHMSVCSRRERYNITSLTYERLKQQRSESMKGDQNPMFGKTVTWSDAARANLSESLRNSQAFHECHNETWKRHISESQSRGVLLINSITGEIVSEWANCSRLAEALDCTRANVKAAVRNGTCIGRKLKSLNGISHWVKWMT